MTRKEKTHTKAEKKIRDNSDKKMKTHKDLLVLKAGKTLVRARGYLATTNQPTTRNRTQAAEVGNLSGKKFPHSKENGPGNWWRLGLQ